MTTVTEARKWLEDIAQWKSLLSDAADTILGVSSPRLTTDGRGTSDGMALPFHLDRAIDEPDKGGAGVKTEAGLLDLLGSWHRSIAHDRGEPAHGSPIAYLQTVLPWAQEHADWDALTSDIRDAHHAMARITGHAAVTLGTCPWDGAKILTDPTTDGIPDWGTCEQCDRWYGGHEDILRATHERWQEAKRSTDGDPHETVTMDLLAEIWDGEVDRNTLEIWAKRGHLIKRKDGTQSVYLLRLANLWIRERLDHPQQDKTRKEDTTQAA